MSTPPGSGKKAEKLEEQFAMSGSSLQPPSDGPRPPLPQPVETSGMTIEDVIQVATDALRCAEKLKDKHIGPALDLLRSSMPGGSHKTSILEAYAYIIGDIELPINEAIRYLTKAGQVDSSALEINAIKSEIAKAANFLLLAVGTMFEQIKSAAMMEDYFESPEQMEVIVNQMRQTGEFRKLIDGAKLARDGVKKISGGMSRRIWEMDPVIRSELSDVLYSLSGARMPPEVFFDSQSRFDLIGRSIEAPLGLDEIGLYDAVIGSMHGSMAGVPLKARFRKYIPSQGEAALDRVVARITACSKYTNAAQLRTLVAGYLAQNQGEFKDIILSKRSAYLTYLAKETDDRCQWIDNVAIKILMRALDLDMDVVMLGDDNAVLNAGYLTKNYKQAIDLIFIRYSAKRYAALSVGEVDALLDSWQAQPALRPPAVDARPVASSLSVSEESRGIAPPLPGRIFTPERESALTALHSEPPPAARGFTFGLFHRAEAKQKWQQCQQDMQQYMQQRQSNIDCLHGMVQAFPDGEIKQKMSEILAYLSGHSESAATDILGDVAQLIKQIGGVIAEAENRDPEIVGTLLKEVDMLYQRVIPPSSDDYSMAKEFL